MALIRDPCPLVRHYRAHDFGAIDERAPRLATLVERRSRFVMLVKIGAKTSEDVVAAHANFTLATNVRVYFCDPHSPWQRGSNENTNGPLRQYFPKGRDLSRTTQAQLDAVANELNTRPRKAVGFRTPAAVFAEALR